MSPSVLLSLCIVAAAGMAVAVQGMLNATLGRVLDSTLAAAAVSFGIGFLALVALTLVVGDGAAFLRVPSVRIWLLTGGLMGAYFVWSITWGVPRLGVVSAFAALILGQLVTALFLDASGAFGLATYDITWKRVVAVVLVSAGMILSRF